MKQSVETVQIIPLAQIDDFPDHPFQVKNDEGMEQLVRSIEMNGVLTPVVVRQKEGGRYELISGHRRKYACGILGVTQIPVIVRELSRDDALSRWWIPIFNGNTSFLQRRPRLTR